MFKKREIRNKDKKILVSIGFLTISLFATSTLMAGTNSANCKISTVQADSDAVFITCSEQTSGDCNLNMSQYTNPAYDKDFENRIMSLALSAKAIGTTVLIQGYVSADGNTCRIDKMRINMN